MDDLLGDQTADGRVSELESGPSSFSASGIRAAPGQDLTQLRKDVQDVKRSVSKIRKKLHMFEASYLRYRNETRATVRRVIKEKMHKDLDEICGVAGGLRRKLEALDRSNAANREIMNCQAGSSTDRERMLITSEALLSFKRKLRTLKSQVTELVAAFEVLGQIFQDQTWAIVGILLLFTAMVQHVGESTSECIFCNAIKLQIQAILAIAEIQERHSAVKGIIRKLLNLQQILHHVGIVLEA